MGKSVCITIKDTTLQIEQWHREKKKKVLKYRKSYTLPEGVIQNGYLMDPPFIERLLRAYYSRYGGKQYPTSIRIACDHFLRWVFAVPLMPDKQLCQMLVYHQKDFLPPLDVPYQCQYYKLTKEAGTQRLLATGYPTALLTTYKRMATRLQVKVVAYTPEIECRVSGLDKNLKGTKNVAFYQEGHSYQVAFIEDGHVIRTHLLMDQLTTQDVLLRNWKQFVRYLADEKYPIHQYLVIDEGLPEVYQEIMGDYTFTPSVWQSGEGILPQTVPLKVKKEMVAKAGESTKQLPFEQLVLYALMGMLGVSLLIGGGWTSYWHHKNKQLDLKLNNAYYVALEEERVQHAFYEEQIRYYDALKAEISRASDQVIASYKRLNTVTKPIAQTLQHYQVLEDGTLLRVQGTTPSVYDFLEELRQLEAQFPELTYTFANTNRWESSGFQLTITQRGE